MLDCFHDLNSHATQHFILNFGASVQLCRLSHPIHSFKKHGDTTYSIKSIPLFDRHGRCRLAVDMQEVIGSKEVICGGLFMRHALW